MITRYLCLLIAGVIAPTVCAKTFFVHSDHLGTPRALSGSTGTVVWRADYEPFGHATVDPASAVEFNLRLPGHYFDAETGLHYGYYRDCDPTTGRYLQSDPIGIAGGLNTYLYANANPISVMDPYGLWTWSDAVSQPIVGYSAGFGDAASFGIHPDGGTPGTAGCIGVMGETSSARDALSGAWWDVIVHQASYRLYWDILARNRCMPRKQRDRSTQIRRTGRRFLILGSSARGTARDERV